MHTPLSSMEHMKSLGGASAAHRSPWTTVRLPVLTNTNQDQPGLCFPLVNLFSSLFIDTVSYYGCH